MPHPFHDTIRAFLLCFFASSLSACSVLSVNPSYELLKAGNAVALSAIATGPSKARNLVHHELPEIKSVCIEYNPATPVPEIVPALQQELKAQGIDSRAYETDGLAAACQFRVDYAADIDWDIPPMDAATGPICALRH